MAEIIMPKMGDAMTEGKVIRWYKQVGEQVSKGEPVLEIETDKVNLDLEAENDGVVESIAVEAGQKAPVGARLAIVRGAGEAATPKKEQAPQREVKGAQTPEKRATPEEDLPREASVVPAKQEPSPPAPSSRPQAAESRGPLKSSPLARRMARELGVDIGAVRGSGPAGRVIASDVEQASKSGAAPAGQTAATPAAPPAKQPRETRPQLAPMQTMEQKSVELTAMRRTIATRLAESLGPIPHFYLTVDLDVTNLLELRQQLADISSMKISVNDFVVRASALALHHHPYVNASFAGDSIQYHAEVHVGIAVATPEGLITPVIRNADQKSVVDIAAEVRSLADRARNRKLKPDEYQGGTFTISNLGMYGIDEFTAIINPPNSAILAVGAATQQVVALNREMVIRDRMKVTMSCDHRVIDGAAGAEYLKTFRQYIEQPLRLLV